MKTESLINPLNLITAGTNITFLYPLLIALSKGEEGMGLLIANAAFWSFISHLVENHKHGMGTKAFPKEYSRLLNILDGTAAMILLMVTLARTTEHEPGFAGAMSYFLLLPFQVFFISPQLFIAALLSFLCGLISEKFSEGKRWQFILFHSIWHLSIFIILGLWLELRL